MTTLDPVPVCEIGIDVLRRFAAGETQGTERRSVLEHLLRGCPSCRQNLRGIQQLGAEPGAPSGDASQVTALLATLNEKAARIEQERADAAALMEAFRSHPINRQWTLIRNSARYDTWQFASRLVDLAFEAIYDDARSSQELARMALTVALRLDRERYGERLVLDLCARARAHVGNAQRALGHLAEAETTLGAARSEMLSGSGDPLLEAEILYFESSLARAQRRFDRALAKVRAAGSIYRELGDEHLEGLTVLGEGSIRLVMGSAEESLRCYRRAVSLVRRERDRHLALAARHNVVHALVESGAADEALEELSTFREEYARLGDQSALAKLYWMEGKIHHRCGDHDDADRSLRSAIDSLASLELPYEVAMASLDLASVLADRQRFGEMRRLAADTLVLFRSLGIEREAIAAWLAFQRAVEAETVTTAFIQRLAAFYSDAKNQPGIAFSG